MNARAILLVGTLLLAGPVFAAPNPLSEVTVDVIEEAQPVRDVLRRLEAKHGLNYVVSEEVLRRAGSVTVHLKHVPLDDALGAICAASGLDLRINGSILVILPARRPAPLPEVTEGLLPRNAPAVREERFLPGEPPAARRSPAREEREEERAPATPAGSMAVGNVVEVDLPNRRLQLHVDGVKRDFYLPDESGSDPNLQTARLSHALSLMEEGFRVALLYRREGSRSLITDLIGGAQVRAATLGQRRPSRQRRGAGQKAPPPPTNARTAPEAPSAELPEGVLAGRFLGRDGEQVQIERGDGEVLTCFLPQADEDPERRDKVVGVVEGLVPQSRVFLTFERVDGKIYIKDTGITEAPRRNE